MGTREKLIEILKRIDAIGDASIVGIEALADNLIENGVTVQQWIPVAERLPDDSCKVVACAVNGEGKPRWISCVFYSSHHKLFNASDWFSNEDAERTAVYPDFWMPMPVLYKEEHGEA